MGDYVDEDEEDSYGYNTGNYDREHRIEAMQSFSHVDEIDESIGDPHENIRYLKEKLSLAAQAGLSLLKDNEDMKEKLAQASTTSTKLMEELSAERHKNRQQATTLMMEYEAKMQDMQKEVDEAKDLTVKEILNSRQYVKLSEKFETAQLKIKDLESKVTHLENMRISHRSNTEATADLEEAFEQSEAVAGREKVLLSRIEELEAAKAVQGKVIDDMTVKLTAFETNLSGSEDILNEYNSLKEKVEKLKVQLEMKDGEIEKEHELADRAIEECKRLSVQILLSTDEMISLRNKIYKLENVQFSSPTHEPAMVNGDNSNLSSFFTKVLNRFMQ